MQIRNVSGVARTIAATDQDVEPDGVVEVPDELGASLLEQPANWASVGPAPKKGREVRDDAAAGGEED